MARAQGEGSKINQLKYKNSRQHAAHIKPCRPPAAFFSFCARVGSWQSGRQLANAPGGFSGWQTLLRYVGLMSAGHNHESNLVKLHKSQPYMPAALALQFSSFQTLPTNCRLFLFVQIACN